MMLNQTLSLAVLCLFIFVRDGFALGQVQYVENISHQNSFPIVKGNTAAGLYVDSNDFAGVVRAANELKADVIRVTGVTPAILHEETALGKNAIIVGTIGRSRIIDRLIRDGKIDVSQIAGKWESFLIQVAPKPLPGVASALVIAGSDKRGTIYGVYDLSEQMGVSPWYWWADVTPEHKDALFVKPGRYVQGPPSVKYRGIFLNDEAPDLTNWVREKYGSVAGLPNVANYGRGFYTNLFELILRLRGNYLWPAMWNNAFNEDDPENPRLADEYGVVMGTSHQEPMLRAQKEWDRKLGRQYGNWNYNNTNQQPVVQQFWREGIRRNKNFESIITLGLRAENDSGAPIGKDLTEQIVNVQRTILGEEINPDLTEVPQMWCLYKEVQDFYNQGLRVPDDVTLLWAEDNWGDVRRLPTADERKRGGGAGVYYHFDYHGGPRSYQWINTSPIPKIWDQLSLAKQYGADRIWIVNVGHFKGYEFPLEYFMHLAWNTDKWTNDNLEEYTRLWAGREFGSSSGTGVSPVRLKEKSQPSETHGRDARATTDEIAKIISSYTRFNGRRKPELLDPTTYSLVNYQEAENVVSDYNALAARAKEISGQLPQVKRDAFYELVLFPVKACAQLNEMYVAAGKNALFAKQGRASANDMAALARSLFQAQTNLMNYFNQTFAGGKWNHFMDQSHIGYTSWADPPRNNLNAIRLIEIEVPDAPAMGVAVEGSATAWPGETNEPVLPMFDAFNQQRHFIDVFNKGKAPFDFTATASEPWIVISAEKLVAQVSEPAVSPTFKSANPSSTRDAQVWKPAVPQTWQSALQAWQVQKDRRVWVSVDWIKARKGASAGTVKLLGPNSAVTVKVNAFNPTDVTRDSLRGFVEGEGFVSIEAEHYTRKTDASANRWIKIDGYGHTVSAMRTTAPVDTSATPGKDSPCLEYRIYLFSAGALEVETIVGPTLNFVPGRGLRYAVSFDDEPPQTITIVPANFSAQNGNRDWEASVRDNCRKTMSTHQIEKPGYHTLKIWMIDPAVALQKIVVNTGGVKPSYLGPPESYHRSNSIR